MPILVRLGIVLGLCCCALPLTAAEATRLLLAREGQPVVHLVLAADAIPAEVTAAQELALYLGRITGGSYRLFVEGDADVPAGAAIFIGTEPAGASREELAAEEWIIRPVGGSLVLRGGRPRGTLYAVYRFLEDELGVRWWTHFEEFVPRRPTLEPRLVSRRGQPQWGYRDVFGLKATPMFLARNRVNGHFSRLGPSWGGSERYGPPKHVHNAFVYVPPHEFFDSHPHFFSELAGFRYAGRSQLCLTQPELVDVVVERMRGYIEQAREQAARAGVAPPRLFAFSQNDWGAACECAVCSAAVEEQGAGSAPLVAFLNRVAERIETSHPDVLIDTLAYMQTLEPPARSRLRSNVAVRFAPLQERDYLRPLRAAGQGRAYRALGMWAARTEHLRVWDYLVTYGDDGALPLPNLRAFARDLRDYHALGVEGLFVQHDFPVASDMRDLKSWVLFKLMEDPRLDYDRLLHEFTDGYYGRAGRTIRRYLAGRERAAGRSGEPIGFLDSIAAYRFIDRRWIGQAQRLLQRAEARVEDDPLRLRRVRHARLSLDRATLLRWRELGGFSDEVGIDFTALLERYRRVYREQVELRLSGPARERALEELDADVARLCKVNQAFCIIRAPRGVLEAGSESHRLGQGKEGAESHE